MNYNIYIPTEFVDHHGVLLAVGGLIATLIIAPLVLVGYFAESPGKGNHYRIYVASGTIALIGAILMTIGFPLSETESKQKSQRFTSWLDKNYSYQLTKDEVSDLQLNEEVVVKTDGELQKITLENYKDGLILMVDGKAIKQK
jgi:hypothetical protein